MKYHIRTKLIIVSMLLLAVPSLVIGNIAYTSSKQSLDDLGAVGLQNDVRMAMKLIDSLDSQVESGDLSLDEAKEMVKQQILGNKKDDGKREIDKSIDIGENGYFFVMSKDGKLLAHPSLEGENIWETEDPNGVKVGQVVADAALNGDGFIYYEWPLPNDDSKVAPKVTYAEYNENWDWIVAAGTYMMDFNKQANKILYALLITLGVALIVGVIIIILFSQHISKPIYRIAKQVHRVADGDLTGEPLIVKNRDEVGLLATDVNKMTTNLKEMISYVSKVSNTVADESSELMANTDQTRKASEQISVAMDEVASGADKQLTNMHEAKEDVSEMAVHVEEITEKISDASKSTQFASSTAKNGNEVIHTAINQINLINTHTKEAAEMLELLTEKSNEIESIITMITAIADQTNLLALNASIEAARAGEHGKGFAVVADEVRKLAEQSGNAASQIGQLIAVVQEEIGNANKVMGEGRSAVKEGTDLVEQAGGSFVDITKAVDEVTGQMKSLSTYIYQVREGANGLVDKIQVVGEISESSANHTQHVAAVTEEQNAAIEEVSSLAAMLADIADELNHTVKKFKF
ncbi:methyl-accepting chemotaxis protein [Bacillus tianshenii]|nr:methyl-accepting chemotaxis protein [Bacillus tianshenii]